MNRSTSRILEGVAIAAGLAAVGELVGVLPELVPAPVAGLGIVAAQFIQKLLTESAWRRNWDGSPAALPAPPEPSRANPPGA